MNEFVKKIIARDGSREEIVCDAFEANRAMEGEIDDFQDKTVICIKFQFSDNPDFVDAEDTNWYINDIYTEKFMKPIILDDEIEGHEQHAPFSMINDVYTIYSDFIPEVLLFEQPKEFDLFEAFDCFYREHMDDFDKKSSEELIGMFEDYLKNYRNY